MKMKLLDCTLLAILAGAAPMAVHASDAAPPTGATAPAATCDGDTCTAAGGEVLMRVRTRGEREPQTQVTSDAASSQALAPDRRVDVELEAPGRAVAIGKWSLQLPAGGVVWATEDPNLGTPALNITAPSLLKYDGSRIVEPVRFHGYSNYPAFIERAEVLVFAGSDDDLVAPLATVPLPAAAVAEAEWDGTLPASFRPRPGDELQYIVRAHGADGSIDETYPRRMQLVRPEDAERSALRQRDAAESALGMRLDVDDAQRRSLVEGVFGGNALRQQNIRIHGSKIRIQGRNLPEGASLSINGQSHPVDLERKMVAEYLVPIGQHRFAVEVTDRERNTLTESLDVDVTGRYLFAVAIADLTASGGNVSGSIQPLAGDERYDDSFLLEGRLAFYLKGKVQGKYLITAQADTQEREVSQLFNGFWDADPQDIFRRLDPDEYYPVYGDDSTTWRDVDTQGRLYVRVDWDGNQALWGNYQTGLTGTEYGQYSRALYGAAFDWRSRRSTAYGAPGTELRAFASEAQTLPGHSEFLGTGGSLYYLRHTDVLPGSEQVVLEVRDPTTGRVEHRVPLVDGADYQIDDFQGRLILTRPLSQVTRENVPSLTRDAPLDGWAQVLLVDYEYVPSGGIDGDEVTAGLRAKHWFGDHLGVGATWVEEQRAGEDYAIRGADLTLQAGRGTWLKLEHTETEATGKPVFFSDDGGLSFSEINSGLGARDGQAQAAEVRANFRELGWTTLDWSAGGWWRRVDGGFSISRFDTGAEIEERGAEVFGQFSPDLDIRARWSRAERDADALEQAQLTAIWRLNDRFSLGGELRRVIEERSGIEAAGTLAALEARARIGTSLDLYAIAQVTVDDDSGAYEDNDALTVGADYLFGQSSTIGAEVTSGDRGHAATVDAEYRLSPEHAFYGGYTWSPDSTGHDPLFTATRSPGWTLGQRWRLSNRANLFNESQYLRQGGESGLAHTFGMDFFPGLGWNLGFTLQDAELDAVAGQIDRRAVSVSGGRTSNATQWQSKLEWREDSGAAQREQWVTTNRLLHKVNEDLRLAARFNYSETDDDLDAAAGAKFIEGNLGFAWRPVDTTEFALLGRLTWLYDVSSLDQVGDGVAFYDQRSAIAAVEGVWMPTDRWEFAGKLMRREGEVRMGRLEGNWADSAATFAAAQLRFGFAPQWHSLAEVRWLGVDDGGDRSGLLVGVDRDIGRNFRVGVGFNFTDFSDDLTDFDYDHRGWYLNVVGSY